MVLSYRRYDDIESKWIYQFLGEEGYAKFDRQCEYLKYSSSGEFLRDLVEEFSIIPSVHIDSLKRKSYLYRKYEIFYKGIQFIPGRQAYLIEQFKYFGADDSFYLVGSEWLKKIILDADIPIQEVSARLTAFKRLNEHFGEKYRKTPLIEKLQFYYDSRKSLEEIKKQKTAEEVTLYDEEQKLTLLKDSILLQKRYEELIKSINRLIEIKEQEENSKIEEIEKLRQELNQTQNELNKLKENEAERNEKERILTKILRKNTSEKIEISKKYVNAEENILEFCNWLEQREFISSFIPLYQLICQDKTIEEAGEVKTSLEINEVAFLFALLEHFDLIIRSRNVLPSLVSNNFLFEKEYTELSFPQALSRSRSYLKQENVEENLRKEKSIKSEMYYFLKESNENKVRAIY